MGGKTVRGLTARKYIGEDGPIALNTQAQDWVRT